MSFQKYSKLNVRTLFSGQVDGLGSIICLKSFQRILRVCEVPIFFLGIEITLLHLQSKTNLFL